MCGLMRGSLSQSDANIVASPAKTALTRERSRKQTTREWLLALALLFAFVALTTGGSQLSNLAFTEKKFKAPFLFVLFKTAFRSLAFPIYLVVNTVAKLFTGRKLDYRRTWRRCLAVCGEDGITIRVVFYKFFPPMFFNLIVQVSFTLGIQYLSPSLASALTPPAVATSYLMAWFFLKNKLLTFKVVFVLVTFVGVGIIAYDQLQAGFETGTLIGIVSMIVQDVSLSSYQILFKKSFPKGDLGQVSFAVSGIYLLMSLVYLPIPVILQQIGYETYTIAELPYPFLIGAWSCTSVSSIVYGYGLVIAGGFFMGLSDLLILGANSGIDRLRSITIPASQILGTTIISGAFLILVLPDRYVSVDIRRRVERCRFRNGCSWPSFGLGKPTDSQMTLEVRNQSQESFPDVGSRIESAQSLDISAIGEEDILENRDLHIRSKDTQLRI